MSQTKMPIEDISRRKEGEMWAGDPHEGQARSFREVCERTCTDAFMHSDLMDIFRVNV